MRWQKASGYNARAKIEASIGRYQQVIGDGLRFRRDNRRTTEVAIAVTVMDRMLYQPALGVAHIAVVVGVTRSTDDECGRRESRGWPAFAGHDGKCRCQCGLVLRLERASYIRFA